MSITSSGTRKAPYTGNGVTTAFPFTFKVFQASDVLVVQTDNSATPTDTTLTLTTHYTVTLNANQDSNPGGTVNMLVAPPSGYLLTIGSQVPQLQSVTLTNNGGFYPTVINNALDYLTILVQQLSEKLGRSLTMPFSSNASGQLPPVSPGSLLGWKSDGSGIANVGATGVGAGGIVATNLAAGATGTALSTDTQAAVAKTTPVDADLVPLFDSASVPAFGLKRLTWANLKAALLNMTGAINFARTTVASAASPDIWTGQGNIINYTGTVTTTGFANAPQAGATRYLDCAAACSFTAGANMLIDGVPSGSTVTVAAGDRVLVFARTTTQFVLTWNPVVGAASFAPTIKGAFKNYAASAIGVNNYNCVVTADEAVLENSANQCITARAVNKTINANGTVGAPLSIMSARAASTWYFIWLWYNATAGITATLDTSSTVPTAPTGYASGDYNARMPGAVLTDASGSTYLMQTLTKGWETRYIVLSGSNVATARLMASGTTGNVTTPTWSALGISGMVPTTARCIDVYGQTALNAQTIVAPNNQYGGIHSTTNLPVFVADGAGSASSAYINFFGRLLLESSNIYWATTNGTIFCYGWTE